MSDSNIYNMNDRQLRNEVQLLRDELAIMKRKYEDIIYNLDTDNFSQRVVKQGKDMYTKIEQTADEISLQAEKVGENTKNLAELKITAEEIQSEVFEENEDGTKTSRITQTADAIRSEVKSVSDTINGKFDNYSTKEQTAERISASVTETKEYAEGYVTNVLANGDYVTSATLQSQLDISANGIYSEVSGIYETKNDASTNYSTLESKITQQKNRISAVISGTYTGDMLNNYLTGIEITPNNIKMIASANAYSVFSSDGLRFYDSMNQVEGWSIEPADDYGGVLNYYVNDGMSYSFGARPSSEYAECQAREYAYTDMCLKAFGQRGRFVVDVTDSDYPEVKFVGLFDYSTESNEPRIYANGRMLATQNWVLKNAGTGGTAIAVFG